MHLPLSVSTLISVNESCLGLSSEVIIRDPELVGVEGPKNLPCYQAPFIWLTLREALLSAHFEASEAGTPLRSEAPFASAWPGF